MKEFPLSLTRTIGLLHVAIPARRTAGMLACSFAILWCSISQAQSPGPAQTKRQQIEDAVKKFMAANSLPGISVAVVEDGNYEWSSDFGMADLENFVPATSSTLYRLGSVSTPITATAAMVLYERGKLDLDAPVQK
jgi:serine beta-lactamase-like protein LACTB